MPNCATLPKKKSSCILRGAQKDRIRYYISDDFKKASLIIESLKFENQPIRLFCAKKLTDLDNILGVVRIEDELIPFITDLILNF